jgi:hypothetical protein
MKSAYVSSDMVARTILMMSSELSAGRSNRSMTPCRRKVGGSPHLR